MLPACWDVMGAACMLRCDGCYYLLMGAVQMLVGNSCLGVMATACLLLLGGVMGAVLNL